MVVADRTKHGKNPCASGHGFGAPRRIIPSRIMYLEVLMRGW